MYASLKPWLNVPYAILPFIKYNGAGTKIYGERIESKCHPTGDVRKVLDVNGSEVTSTATLYVDGNEPIKDTDTVIFEGKERSILRITNYYRDGKPDIKVVYL
jgi:hypothetical protein